MHNLMRTNRARATLSESFFLQAEAGSSGDDRVRQQLTLTESLDSVAVLLAAAEKHLSQHASMLPIYEVRSLQASFKEVGNQFQELQDRLQPKKKFGFSGRRNKKTEKKEVRFS